MISSLKRNILAFVLTFGAFSLGLLGGMTSASTAAARDDPYEGLDVFARAMTQIQQGWQSPEGPLAHQRSALVMEHPKSPRHLSG